MTIVVGFRVIWTTALLWLVWLNAHWSVALLLTLMAVGNEATGLLIHRALKQLRELSRLEEGS